ncbi:MAG: YceI family protein [Sulfurimonas sp.]|uniref:YceI family protein n=1 Tax=Sulfurimonas sp. TaxID=2022749 RepID=UPI0026286A6C|nr:YceI family protein [Sulfurimonas sp.]MCW8896184.1 YceI family protein [Sulfurimonas sp.]MCW8954292.1 YceI family protein [Sulfurimonas sp.]MCW9068424.1 YceI family protein [Sulfurimonas sp.]
MKKLQLIIVSMLLGASSLFGGEYKVDPSHTNVTFSVKHMMISTVNGEFQSFEGSFELEDETNKLVALSGEMDVESINTNIERRDAHLKSSEIFNAEEYPQVTFVLDRVKGDKAYGKLTIKGITKDVELEYEFGGTVTDPWGKQRAGLSLSGKIDRRDYNITWNQALEAGGVVVSEIVKLNIEIQGILKSEDDF